jgi:hypothetical protein
MGILPDLLVGESRTGKGVFAGRAFKGEDPVFAWQDKLVLREHLEPGAVGIVQVGPGLFLPHDPIGDFFNHSCDPNTALIAAEGKVQLRAIQDIPGLQEITFDYSITADGEGLDMDCLCGTLGCRVKIGDWKNLPVSVRARYIALGIVPEHIRSK